MARWGECLIDILYFHRFASNIASEGYIVALPSSFHEFEGPEPIPYDSEGTDRGNCYKVRPFFFHRYQQSQMQDCGAQSPISLLGRKDS